MSDVWIFTRESDIFLTLVTRKSVLYKGQPHELQTQGRVWLQALVYNHLAMEILAVSKLSEPKFNLFSYILDFNLPFEVDVMIK